ncbi:PfkB family carbohydrate kinase [Ruegeria sp. HKCCD8929]|uniref:PfkB family carbohydrate kinase n=1 Tax=Ruegeria sp. HKCCD8929 TaxID=2683006 RepID=UPI001489E35D|nr:PfkB family carbohydrate kinase [Ruegeria sp. HKCCD8929]
MSARLLQMSGVVVDLLYSVAAVPAPGEEAIVDSFSIKPGGGFNAMVAAKRAGMDVWYGGALGTGPFARIVREGLNQEAIPFLRPQDTERDQGCCTVLIDQTGERTFIASDGAEGHATAQALSQVTASGFDWTLLSGYALHYKGSCWAMQDWLQSDAPISNLVFDPSPVVSALPADALEAARARATWISANAREAAILTGITDPVEAARALASEIPKDGGAVVRDGRNGCVIATDELCERVPAYPVTPVDTNGAGDAHLGSFIARLAQRSNPLDAARYANVAAALSTTKKGPATAPEKEEVAAAMNRKEAV